eukprot:jgi/Psemu1/2133/gm1.2133_g
MDPLGYMYRAFKFSMLRLVYYSTQILIQAMSNSFFLLLNNPLAHHLTAALSLLLPLLPQAVTTLGTLLTNISTKVLPLPVSEQSKGCRGHAISLFHCAKSASTLSASASAFASDGNSGVVVLLEEFFKPIHAWKELNDPVMGGELKVVHICEEYKRKRPITRSLPTFRRAKLYRSLPDRRQSMPATAIALEGHTLPDVPTDIFGEITIPFLDDTTGEPIHKCQEDSRFCPDELTLKNIKMLEIWGEGVGDPVDLQVHRIPAVGYNSDVM